MPRPNRDEARAVTNPTHTRYDGPGFWRGNTLVDRKRSSEVSLVSLSELVTYQLPFRHSADVSAVHLTGPHHNSLGPRHQQLTSPIALTVNPTYYMS